MASRAYFEWVAAGRPLEPCTPVREFVERMRLAFPMAAKQHQFSWYADEDHYRAEPPLDHTPFSATGWPLASPRWVVFATDIMHRPDLGVDCHTLFAYWIAEARAGRMPWLKYLIWQGKLYHARSKFVVAEDSDGHFDHIHLSFRTDYRYTSLGAWHPAPGKGNDMYEQPDRNTATADTWRLLTILEGRPAAQYHLTGEKEPRSEPNNLQAQLDRIENKNVTLSDEDRAAIVADIVAELKPLLPTAEQIAAAMRPVIDSELDEAFSGAVDKD